MSLDLAFTAGKLSNVQFVIYLLKSSVEELIYCLICLLKICIFVLKLSLRQVFI